MLSATRKRAERGYRISNAFIRMDAREEFNYPLGFGMRSLSSLVPVVTFFFIAQFVGTQGAAVGYDYYTFVVIGLIGMGVLGAGLQSLSSSLARTINLGRLEMLLVEPIRWRVLPFVLVQWQIVVSFTTAAIVFGGSLFFGASYRWQGLPAAVLILLLGLAATLGIGILNASLKVLSKRADPVLAIYGVAASILSGTFYSVEVLPDWIRPLAWLLPHTYVLQALRRVMMPAGADLPGPSAWQASLALVGFCLVLYPLGLWIYGRAFEYGRRAGLLSGY